MQANNPFDKKIDANPNIRGSTLDALTHCVDVLDWCWAGAQAVFGQKAKPEHALALLPLALAQIKAEQERSVGHAPERTAGEPTP